MELKEGMYVRTNKGFITQVIEFKRHYTKGKRLVTSSSVKEVDENYLRLKGDQCDFIDSIDCSIPPCYPSDEELETIEKSIVKASYSIIDLIEVGDYVNGYLVIEKPYSYFDKQFVSVDTQDSWSYGKGEIPIENIKSIVTHELFKTMEYEVE